MRICPFDLINRKYRLTYSQRGFFIDRRYKMLTCYSQAGDNQSSGNSYAHVEALLTISKFAVICNVFYMLSRYY